MLTNNFYRMLSQEIVYGNTPLPIVTVEGTSVYSSYYSSYLSQYFSNATAWTNTPSGGGIIVGSGTTPASKEDTYLENQISSFTVDTISRSYTFGNDYLEIVFTFGLRNTGADDFTISEIGYVTGYRTSSTKTSYALIDRTILDTPITIPAGDARSMSYSIRLNWPT